MSTWGPRQVTPKAKSVANRMNVKLRQPISPTPHTSKKSTSVLKKKKNNKCTNAWKELKMLVNKAASKIPSAPAVLSPIKRCSSTSKIPNTPRTTKTTNAELRLHQRSNLSTRLTEGTTNTAPKKRSSKRPGSKEGIKSLSKGDGQQSAKVGVKKQVGQVLNRSDSAATSIDSVSIATSMVSPFVLQQRTVKAPTHRSTDELYNDFAAADPERGECSREDSTACDPPVLSRINEGWPEGRVSIEASSFKHNTLDAPRKVDEASVATSLAVERECERCLSACAQASQSADRLLEEITFIQDSTAARKRRKNIPPWIRERYQKSNKGLRSSTSSSSATARKTRAGSAGESKVKSTTRIKQGMRDSPMDATTPLGASYYVNTCTRRRNQTEILDTDLTDFFNLRGQTPINLSGSWMHHLQKLAEKDLEAPLQSELRTCLARLAKLEFENRALKELVLLKCGLPKHLGIHKLNRSGTPSTLLEDPENSYTLKSGISELKHHKARRPETFDSFHEYFMTD